MDARELIDRLLESGKSYAETGQSFAEEKLNMPPEGPERDAMLSGLGKGALAAGSLALLLGTRTGRGIAGGLLKVGSVAAIGGLAYKTYKDWQDAKPDTSATVRDITNPADDTSDEHSRLILSAMIAASKADGHIDDDEKAGLQSFVERIGESPELTAFVKSELEKPVDPALIASRVSSSEVGAEVYLATLLIVDQSNFMAKSYLDALATALKLPPDLVSELNRNVEPAV
ncbi:MAG: tellurite resistance TerB family protein [Pseudomonadota bacterium]